MEERGEWLLAVLLPLAAVAAGVGIVAAAVLVALNPEALIRLVAYAFTVPPASFITVVGLAAAATLIIDD